MSGFCHYNTAIFECSEANIQIDYIPVGLYDYYPYGKTAKKYEASDRDRKKYLTTQHQRDTETNLDYRGARYYDSDILRFTSVDPLASDFRVGVGIITSIITP